MSDSWKLARRDDPDTSPAAAASIDASRQHREIYAAMKMANKPLTAEEIGDLVGYPAWRRMNELEKLFLVYRTDVKRRQRSGRQAYTYETAIDRDRLEASS